ncbi:MAG: FAD-dependent monooxygenase [Rickettsiales bacterium]|nr:FAD-dependent monooxygenase [Rickettsiales bacterium]
MIETEVIIVGSGLTGLIAARYFEKTNIKYVLIDKNNIASVIKNDLRTTAINYTVCQNFQYLGIWDELSENAGPIKNIIIRDQKSSEVLFKEGMVKFSPMGYILPNSKIKSALLKKISDKNLLSKTEVLNISSDNNFIYAETNQKTKIKAKLVIAADGKFSNLKSNFNIEDFEHNYKQTSYIFNVTHSKNHNNFALEQFLNDGPLAFLPLHENDKSSVVFTKSKNANNSKDFIEKELNEIAADYYGDIKINSEIKSFPIFLKFTNKYYLNRIVFVGDALHSIHPVAGQGFNLTVSDIEKLIHLILKFKKNGMDFGSKIMLAKFKKDRLVTNNSMVATTHFLVKLFSNSNNFVNLARNSGLKIFDRSKMLKKSAIAHAMGLK